MRFLAIMKKVFNVLTEGARGIADFAALKREWKAIAAATPHGDGMPVLVLPGIMNDDLFMRPLHNALNEKGHKAYGWEGGVNTGLTDATAAHLAKRLDEVYAQNGGRKVALVGHSLGGIYARELAREFPDKVELVVTLSSPFGLDGKHVPKILVDAYTAIHPRARGELILDEALAARRLTPPPVPTTSIYTVDDGVVPWRSCINPAAENAENIEVAGSHTGIIYHPAALTVLLDRLSQKQDSWAALDREKYKTVLRGGPQEHDIPANPAHAMTEKTPRFF